MVTTVEQMEADVVSTDISHPCRQTISLFPLLSLHSLLRWAWVLTKDDTWMHPRLLKASTSQGICQSVSVCVDKQENPSGMSCIVDSSLGWIRKHHEFKTSTVQYTQRRTSTEKTLNPGMFKLLNMSSQCWWFIVSLLSFRRKYESTPVITSEKKSWRSTSAGLFSEKSSF
jgi:hypothetical protein